MMGDRSDHDEVKLTLLVYIDGLTSVLTSQRIVVDIASSTFGSITNREEEVQTLLDRFYEKSAVGQYLVKSVDLIFVNSIFYKTNSGSLEAFKNRLAAFVLYHKSFFQVQVSYDHIASRLIHHLEVEHKPQNESVLWFHLRQHHLFVLFGTPKGDYSIKSFEVRKTLDVYYYVLFNIQTLSPILTDLKEIVISGELLDMNNFDRFFKENVPDQKMSTYWEWKKLLGRPNQDILPFLPEVNI